MTASLQRTSLEAQIRALIAAHSAEISQFLHEGEPDTPESAQIVRDLEALAAICACAPENASASAFYAAHMALSRLTAFFTHINQDCDDRFHDTQAGMIWRMGAAWCEAVRALHGGIPVEQVWELIAPAVPDSLIELGGGVYEATWAAPVPMDDIEALRRSAVVQMQSDWFEPPHLPNGVGVHFSVVLA